MHDRTPALAARQTTSGAALGHGAGSQEADLGRAREPLPSRVSDTPSLPPSFGAALDDGLAALGLPLSESARRAIEGHARLLLAWTGAINLTAIRDPADVARFHVLDSLTAVPLLRDRGIDAFVDLGSGGGYPGVPLAAVLGGRALLVDSVAKKARFLEVAVEAVGLGPPDAGRVAVRAERAEAVGRGPDRERWPAVVARAVGTLAELAELALPVLEVGGVLVAWKRGDLEGEIGDAERLLPALGGGRPTVHPVELDGLAGHRLVEIPKVAPTPARYPRDPAARRREAPTGPHDGGRIRVRRAIR